MPSHVEQVADGSISPAPFGPPTPSRVASSPRLRLARSRLSGAGGKDLLQSFVLYTQDRFPGPHLGDVRILLFPIALVRFGLISHRVTYFLKVITKQNF